MLLSGAILAALLASAVAVPTANNPFADYEKRQFPTTRTSTTSTSTTATPTVTGSASVLRTVGGSGNPEYVVNITIGGQPFTHLLDTGSADDWVFGPRYPRDRRGGNKANYTANFTSTARPMTGFFDVRYGTGQEVAGPILTDNVFIGNVTSNSSVVGVAINSGYNETLAPALILNSISDFSSDDFNGIIGLSPPINATARKNWINKVVLTFKAPVFCARFLKRATGSWDFGFIDKTKITGSVHNTTIVDLENRWAFNTTGIKVGTLPTKTFNVSAITYADTGAPSLVLDRVLVRGYYDNVIGSEFIPDNATDVNSTGTYTLPCSGILPTLSIDTGSGYYATIIRDALVGDPNPDRPGQCFGTLQELNPLDPNSPPQIYGVPLFESQYVVHNPNTSTIGFAQRTDVSYLY
jgi:aspergillopepsin I